MGGGLGGSRPARTLPQCPRLRVAVEETDGGLYTCNLHHHYCHLYESLAIRLEVTDNRECAVPPPRRPSFRRGWPAPGSPRRTPHAQPQPPPPGPALFPPRAAAGPPALTRLRPQPGPPARTGTARRRCWWRSAARLRC